MPDPTSSLSFAKRIVADSLPLFALAAFAVAQPIYAVISTQVGFLTANQFEPFSIVLLLLLLSLGFPLLLVLIREMLGLIRPIFGDYVQKLLIALLGALLVLPFLKPVPGLLALLLAVVAGLGLLWLYIRKEAFRSMLAFASVASLIFPVLFLLSSKVTPLLVGTEKVHYKPSEHKVDTSREYPPVVVVFWDELPTSTLLDETGQIDPIRYPSFAEFASQATWFRNMNSVGGSTIWAIPAMLTGQTPTHEEKHSPRQLKTNLFTLLARTHSMENTIEKHTSLCPKAVCHRDKPRPFKKVGKSLPDIAAVYLHVVAPADMKSYLPDVSNNWGDFVWGGKDKSKLTAGENKALAERKKRLNEKMAVPDHKRGLFHKFLRRMKPMASGQKPPLYFMHIVFPHVPYNYMPSGKYYNIGAYKYFTTWQDERQIYYDYQRHLLQVGATDALMGEMIARLKELELYDKAVVIVAADHGASWGKPGTERRMLGPQNYPNLMQVPFLIKMPGQTEGKIIDRPVLITDILPTLADLLDIPLPAPVDGHSILAKDYPAFEKIHIIDNLGKNWYDFPLVTEAQKRQLVDRKMRWFGSGDPERIFTTNPHLQELIGRRIDEFPLSQSREALFFRLESPEVYDAVDLNDQFMPTQVVGTIETSNGEFPDDVVIAVNDVIWSTFPYLNREHNQLRFEAMVPEKSLQKGQNSIRVFSVSKTAGRIVLSEIRNSRQPAVARGR